MKSFIFILLSFFPFSLLFAVDINNPVKFSRQDSDHIKEIMTSWDKEKGLYLYESLAAMVMHEQQPERPNGVNQTTFELLQTMSEKRIERLDKSSQVELEKEKNARKKNRENDGYFWEEWRRYLQNSNCGVSEGFSNGDPHLKTFDGQRYDFQNAGDYVLAASEDGTFMVQSQMIRTSPGSAISQNGGLVMNINGDILEFKGKKTSKEDGLIYINRELMPIKKTGFILPQGGVVDYNKSKYIVKWPTGEQITVRVRGNDKQKLFDVFISVPECRENYYGLLGNNDGDKTNDLYAYDRETGSEIQYDSPSFSFEDLFGPNRSNPEVLDKKTDRARFISHQFGDMFMLDSTSSMFIDQMTNIPDEIRYPQEHLSLAQLSDEQIETGLKKAREAGITEEDLYGAVYDYGHINLDPDVYFDDDDRAEREVKRETDSEPKLENTNTNKTNSQSSSSTPVRVNQGVFIGTGTKTPPNYRRPITSKPYQTSPGTGSNNTNVRRPNSSSTKTPSTPSVRGRK